MFQGFELVLFGIQLPKILRMLNQNLGAPDAELILRPLDVARRQLIPHNNALCYAVGLSGNRAEVRGFRGAGGFAGRSLAGALARYGLSGRSGDMTRAGALARLGR